MVSPRGCLPSLGVCHGGVWPVGCLPGKGVCPEGVFAQGVYVCIHLPLCTKFLTQACENITFPQLCLRTVKICKYCVIMNRCSIRSDESYEIMFCHCYQVRTIPYVYWHCMGLGMGTGLGTVDLDLYIMPLTVHTTQAQRRETGLGTNEHTHCPLPFPIPNRNPVQCECAIRIVNILSQICLPLDLEKSFCIFYQNL